MTTANEGKNYNVIHYNLYAIIAVGYRINTKKATDFRIWATKVLKEYVIMTSEKVFWRKVLDIYATSIDYNPKDKL